MIKFRGDEIPGIHGPLVYTTSEPLLRFSNFWDLHGEIVIAGRNSGRFISCTILLFDEWVGTDPKQLLDYLDDLNDEVGQHGELEESGNIVQSLKRCTFLGFEPIPLDGQGEPGPLLDQVGSLWLLQHDDFEDAEPQWFIHGILRWRQARA